MDRFDRWFDCPAFSESCCEPTKFQSHLPLYHSLVVRLFHLLHDALHSARRSAASLFFDWQEWFARRYGVAGSTARLDRVGFLRVAVVNGRRKTGSARGAGTNCRSRSA